jgi:hypothetical protein
MSENFIKNENLKKKNLRLLQITSKQNQISRKIIIITITISKTNKIFEIKVGLSDTKV